ARAAERGSAPGVVEAMGEVACAAGVAAVSPVLVSQVGLSGFHAAFVVICIAGALGAITATVAFERRSRPTDEPAIGPGPPPGGGTLIPLPVPVEDRRGPA